MPGVAVDVGHGTTVTFATSAFTADLKALRLVGMAVRALETSHMGTATAGANTFGNRRYTRGDLVNPGQLIMEIHFNPQANLPMVPQPELVTITWPLPQADPFAPVWETNGFLVGVEITDSLDDVMAGVVTVQLTSEITPGDTGEDYYIASWEWPDLLGPLTERYTASWEV